MKAIGFEKNGPISAPDALVEFEAATPVPGPRDLLVEVRGVSMNPVDIKVRTRMSVEHGPKILGFDAAGVVLEVGSDVSLFQVGDEVFYAGDITRPGTNAQQHVVDERIVGRKPDCLGFAEAAGLPLTSITAWELLFDSLRIPEGGGDGECLLVIGGAGGVGSILIQIASKLTGLTVVATASRPETVAWVEKMGAHHVVNHRQSLADQMKALGLVPRHVAGLTGTDGHFADILELIAPRGHVAMIDDPSELDIKPGKTKALSFSWEYMFARPRFQTADMQVQHDLLNRMSQGLDDGTFFSTVTTHLGRMSVATLIEAHRRQESGRSIGKSVLEGF